MKIRCLLTVSVLLGGLLAANAGPVTENFESFADGAALKFGTGPGWICPVENAPAAPLVRSLPGKGGKVLALPASDVFAEFRNWETPLWTEADGPVEFSVDFQLTGKLSQLNVVVSQYGASGFWVGVAPDAISVGTGGDSAFTATSRDYPAKVASNVWYSLQIRGVALKGNPPAKDVVGKLSVFEKNKPSNLLVDGVKIVAAGADQPFAIVNQLTFRRFGGDASSVEAWIGNVRLGKSKP